MSDKKADFDKPGAAIEQPGDSLARGQFTGAVLLVDTPGAAAFAKFIFQTMEGIDQVPHVGGSGDILRFI
jgi:hypothetical protein